MPQVLHSWRLSRINVESSINQIFFFYGTFQQQGIALHHENTKIQSYRTHSQQLERYMLSAIVSYQIVD